MSQHVEQGDTLDQGDHAAERTPPCGLSTSHRTKNELIKGDADMWLYAIKRGSSTRSLAVR
jgi:hypothetical protein